MFSSFFISVRFKPTDSIRNLLGFSDGADYKQLLDEVFVISKIIKVEVRVISSLPRKNGSQTCFFFFTDGEQHNAGKRDMITCDTQCPH